MRPNRFSRWFMRRLFQWISGADHPDRLHAADLPTLRRNLDWIDDHVPPRRHRQRRHQAHQEWYCAKRYLLALAEAGQLQFPLTVRKGESPDFMLFEPEGETTGLEITEATTEAYQRWLSAKEGDGRLHSPGPEDGVAGIDPELELASLIVDAVRAKATKIAGNSQWELAARHDLLLYYSGTPSGTAIQPGPVLDELQKRLPPAVSANAPLAWPAGPLGRISILTGGVLLYDVMGAGLELTLPEHAG